MDENTMNNNPAAGERTFTQEEVNRIVSERLNKEKAKVEKEIAMFEKQLSNPGFVNKAPANVVEEIRQKLARSQDKLSNVEESLKALG